MVLEFDGVKDGFALCLKPLLLSMSSTILVLVKTPFDCKYSLTLEGSSNTTLFY